MKIFFDTRDIINIFQKSSSEKVDEFKEKLTSRGHELVLSLYSLLEISAPLLTIGTDTNVMRLLNKIEEIPLCFIRSGLTRFELARASMAFDEGREYEKVSPFVNTAAELFNMPLCLLNVSLGELMFSIWKEDPSILKRSAKYAFKLEGVVSSDRRMNEKPPLNTHFREVIKRHFATNGLPLPISGHEQLADWIYKDPNRCPSIRLGYEVFHKFVRNIGDLVKRGDMYDLHITDCLPYVDIMTLERRMASYVRQADKVLSMGYANRICNNVDEIIKRIEYQ